MPRLAASKVDSLDSPGLSLAQSPKQNLTRNQIRGFWAAWGGWTLDGMDSFVYALVLVVLVAVEVVSAAHAAEFGIWLVSVK